jgi:hypothetical protein
MEYDDFLSTVYTGFWWGNLRERDHSEDPVVYGRIILRWIFRKLDGFSDVSQDREKRGALVKALINFLILQNAGNFWTS